METARNKQTLMGATSGASCDYNDDCVCAAQNLSSVPFKTF